VVINQVNKSWDRNKENMDAYYLEVHKLENKLYGLEFHHVVRRIGWRLERGGVNRSR
jgi:hypothetical protein